MIGISEEIGKRFRSIDLGGSLMTSIAICLGSKQGAQNIKCMDTSRPMFLDDHRKDENGGIHAHGIVQA
jgi:hypothetical protein